MTTQRTQTGISSRLSTIGLFASFIVAYAVFSLIVALVILPIVVSLFMACVLSFSSIGLASYIMVHFVMPEEMSRIHSRLLHELAKRKLIEFG